jgi:hypothetical protein
LDRTSLPIAARAGSSPATEALPDRCSAPVLVIAFVIWVLSELTPASATEALRRSGLLAADARGGPR